MTSAPVPNSPKPQHVLVTGGTGFIGRLLVQALRDDGHTVTVWTRKPATAGFDAAVHCVRRLEDIPQTTAVDVVVNLAGAPIAGPRWTDARKAELLRSRVGLTDTLVGWIGQRALKPRVLLSGSAIGYYGVQSQGDPAELTESSPPQAVFMSELCQQWEAAAGAASRHGVRVVCMRFGVVLGHHGSLPLLLLPVKLGVAGKLGTGQQSMSWVHVQDLLRALAHVWRIATDADAPTAPQVYNFTAPGALSQAAFSRTAAEVLHRPFWFPTPGWPLRLALGEQADLMLEGQRVAPARLLASGFQFRFPDARSALQDLC
ncbi:TIGR01777 family oxidoreductase [Variovorax sp. PAMC 28711]|uniref:TIGR01777 family oxidoreductase n=1 Tax=Variovorax sp. PAMC 28711 TaxID=1795631 RepID=UPI00078E69AD|nr:TIGR01777 family oxidoreductase [Variovorax sp. PAMC 28711]AMM24329.1 nucleoside-diphosphate sugar epimerase [Variovorax sp. PAMC 28711]